MCPTLSFDNALASLDLELLAVHHHVSPFLIITYRSEITVSITYCLIRTVHNTPSGMPGLLMSSLRLERPGIFLLILNASR